MSEAFDAFLGCGNRFSVMREHAHHREIAKERDEFPLDPGSQAPLVRNMFSTGFFLFPPPEKLRGKYLDE